MNIPSCIGTSPGGAWWHVPPHPRDKLWRRTNHQWASRHWELALWMPPMCEREYCDVRDDIIMQEAGLLIIPVEPDRCRRCGRIPTPYRPVPQSPILEE